MDHLLHESLEIRARHFASNLEVRERKREREREREKFGSFNLES